MHPTSSSPSSQSSGTNVIYGPVHPPAHNPTPCNLCDPHIEVIVSLTPTGFDTSSPSGTNYPNEHLDDNHDSHSEPNVLPSSQPTSSHPMKIKSQSGIFKTHHFPDFATLFMHALHATLLSTPQPK